MYALEDSYLFAYIPRAMHIGVGGVRLGMVAVVTFLRVCARAYVCVREVVCAKCMYQAWHYVRVVCSVCMCASPCALAQRTCKQTSLIQSTTRPHFATKVILLSCTPKPLALTTLRLRFCFL